jgi:hypothetical protein
LRKPPGQIQTAAELEEHDELDIIDQLGLSDSPTARLPLRTILLDSGEEPTTALKELLTARLDEGHGEMLFDVGLENSGDSMGFTLEEWNTSLQRVESMADELQADCKLLMTRNVGGEVEVGPVSAKEKGASGKLMVRRRPQSIDDVIETRIAVVGNGMLSWSSNCSRAMLTVVQSTPVKVPCWVSS